MASMNKVELIGNLGTDVDIRFTSNGNAVANLRLATNRKYKNKAGETKSDTQWHRVVVWGKRAESCAEFLKKGSPVYLSGRLQTRSWEDKDGITRYTTEIVAEDVQFLGRGGSTPELSTDDPPPPVDADEMIDAAV
jgi:single-strand DNA-binding protein